MKVAGIALTILGGLMVLGGLNTAFTQYDLNSSHDLGKLFGGLGVSAAILLGGLAMLNRSASRR